MTTNRRFLLKTRPTGMVTASLFDFVTEAVPALKAGEVLVKNQYLSVDPTNRIWMTDQPQYMPPIKLGEVVRASGIGVVEDSQLPQFKKGDLVSGLLGWQDYSVHGPGMLNKLPKGMDVPDTAFLGALGLTGCTAYFGLLEVGKPRVGQTLVVSGAAGATGSVVGQIGVLAGLKVVGIAGGPDKCKWLTDELGFHAAIDYKKGAVAEMLGRYAPEGVDQYFDNVGGEVSEAVISRMNLHGTITLCGMISGYNDHGPMTGPKNYSQILMQRLTVRGFIVTDFVAKWADAQKALYGWVKQGKIKYKEDIEQGLENAPKVLNKLFEGTNTGKLILKL